MNTIDRRSRESREAAHWWARLGKQSLEDLSREERQEFVRWLRESPVHVAEMLHMARVHDALERFKCWDEIQLDPTRHDENVVTLERLDEREAENASAAHIRRPDSSRTRFAGFGLAAAAAVAAVMVVAFKVLAPTLSTDRAERREVSLSDGSIVQLDPETAVRVQMTAHERRVVLSRGRALFEVAKDPARPFLVVVNDSVVRAVGTVFGVERRNADVVVTVSEGKVAVLSAAPAAQGNTARRGQQTSGDTEVKNGNDEKVIYVAAGEQTTIDGSGIAAAPHVVNAERALGWADGRLAFESAPLGEVIEEFNRYNRIQLRLSDNELARRPISGVFETSDVETLIAFVQAGANVDVVRKDGGEILISAAQ